MDEIPEYGKQQRLYVSLSTQKRAPHSLSLLDSKGQKLWPSEAAAGFRQLATLISTERPGQYDSHLINCLLHGIDIL